MVSRAILIGPRDTGDLYVSPAAGRARMRIVHLTDAHLSSLVDHSWWSLRGKRRLGYLSWWRKRRHQMQPLALEQLTVAALAQAPDVIAITGDLVHLGLTDEIDAANRWLNRLAEQARVIVVPGNHDCYQADSCAPMRQAWNNHLGLDAGGDFPSLHRQDGVSFFGLSSASPMPFWSAAGEIGQTQLARLDAALTSARSTLRCVLLHHPPQAGVASWRKALRDAGALSAMLERHGVELVLHGHLHSNRQSRLGTRTHVLATAAASSTSARTPASFRVLDVRVLPAGWAVHSSLHVRDPASAAVAVTQKEHWQFAPV